MRVIVRCIGQISGFGDCIYVVFSVNEKMLRVMTEREKLVNYVKQQDADLCSADFAEAGFNVYGDDIVNRLRAGMGDDDFSEFEDNDWHVLSNSLLSLSNLTQREYVRGRLTVCAKSTPNGQSYFKWQFCLKDTSLQVTTAEIPLNSMAHEIQLNTARNQKEKQKAKESKVSDQTDKLTVPAELEGHEYVYVWDSCGELGYGIPWAFWKARGVLPVTARNHTNQRYVSISKLEHIPKAYLENRETVRDRCPILLLEDYIRPGTNLVDWDAALCSIIKVARKKNCVLPQAASKPGLTWGNLQDACAKIPCYRLKEPAQFVISPADGDVPAPTLPAITLAKSGELFGSPGIRTHYDNVDHPDDYVILLDHNRFDTDGSIATDLLTGKKIFPKQ